MIRDLAEVGFAVGETMRSGKAAVGVLGVVGALRLARAAWASGQTNGRRWCTILLPVDCITELLFAPGSTKKPAKRADLLAINLSWNVEGPPALSISPCAVECKYVSGTYQASAVPGALGQAETTYRVVTQTPVSGAIRRWYARAACSLPHPPVRPAAPCRAGECHDR